MTKKKKKKKITGKIILAFIIIVSLIVAGFFVYKIVTKKKDLNIVINEMAVDYYKVYYNNLKEENPNTYKEKLEKQSVKGFKKSLGDIAREVDNEDKYRLYNSKESGSNCDIYKTYAEYHPEKPYGINDYKMNLNIVCKKVK